MSASSRYRDAVPLVVPARVLAELHEHARETHPEECCGLILGRRAGELERVVRCRNEMTRLHRQAPGEYPRDGREAFHMNEADVLEAWLGLFKTGDLRYFETLQGQRAGGDA